ncbi:MAG: nucleotidyltransferase domain-containing protein [Nitrospinae bacterium]|nr:nucleotidyltransferase domain-containing protein [Nitrospinota bacterium]
MDKIELDIPLENIADICKRHDVSELSVFGSSVTGGYGEDSDVDLLVQFVPESRIGFIEFSKIGRELSEAIGRKVDLVPKNGLKPAVREDVLAHAKVIYAR